MGLSKSVLYSHYESKEAIWSALTDKMEAYYAARFGSPEHLPEIPKTVEEFCSFVMQMVGFTIYDEKIILTRKLLLTEQFHNDRVKKPETEHFLNGTKAIFQRILEKMMENEKIIGNMIAWANDKLGISEYAGWCPVFIEDALEMSNDIEIFGGDSGTVFFGC